MDQDYLLIAVDPDSKFAIRFLSLEHSLKNLLDIQKPGPDLRKEFITAALASVILGSRSDEQESTLYKLNFEESDLTINFEVSPKGPFRAAIFPAENRALYSGQETGNLKVTRLKKNNEIYESVIELNTQGVKETFQDYLKSSVQTQSVLRVHADEKDLNKNFALWVEKLPQTELKDFTKFTKRFDNTGLFKDSVLTTNDPDKIIQALFPETIRILTVLKPHLRCSCSKEKIIEALQLLPTEELVEIFMDGNGIETQCDYCKTVWHVEDSEFTDLIKTSSAIH